MKALKVFGSIAIVISLMIITACSDNSLSPLNSGANENQTTTSDLTKGSDNFSLKFTLKHGESLFLNPEFTKLFQITYYSISNCEMAGKDLFISASNIDQLQSLPCSGKDFILDDLLIENTSGQEKTFSVELAGLTPKLEK